LRPDHQVRGVISIDHSFTRWQRPPLADVASLQYRELLADNEPMLSNIGGPKRRRRGTRLARGGDQFVDKEPAEDLSGKDAEYRGGASAEPYAGGLGCQGDNVARGPGGCF
jgi:hypothetical protein